MQVPRVGERKAAPAHHVGPLVEVPVLGPELGMREGPRAPERQDGRAGEQDRRARRLGKRAPEPPRGVQAPAPWLEDLDHLKKHMPSAASDTSMPEIFMMMPAVSWSSAGENPAISRGAYS